MVSATPPQQQSYSLLNCVGGTDWWMPGSAPGDLVPVHGCPAQDERGLNEWAVFDASGSPLLYDLYPDGTVDCTGSGRGLLAICAAPAPPLAGYATSFLSANGAWPGGSASVSAQTTPGASCSIQYVTPDGTVSRAQGLYSKLADANGFVSWVWLIGCRTYIGSGTVTVTCNGTRITTGIQIG
jgi:hypothetical protein